MNRQGRKANTPVSSKSIEQNANKKTSRQLSFKEGLKEKETNHTANTEMEDAIATFSDSQRIENADLNLPGNTHFTVSRVTSLQLENPKKRIASNAIEIDQISSDPANAHASFNAVTDQVCRKFEDSSIKNDCTFLYGSIRSNEAAYFVDRTTLLPVVSTLKVQ